MIRFQVFIQFNYILILFINLELVRPRYLGSSRVDGLEVVQNRVLSQVDAQWSSLDLSSKSEKSSTASPYRFKYLQDAPSFQIINRLVLIRQTSYKVRKEGTAAGNFSSQALPAVFDDDMKILLEMEWRLRKSIFHLSPPILTSINHFLGAA